MIFSIITVSFNSQNTIEDSIQSLIKQSIFNIVQYVVVDGGSIDDTKKILNKHNAKIDILISENDQGIYDAMNKGISLASGDIIGILNSDDVYANESVLEKVAGIFQSNPDIDIVYGDLVYVDQHDLNKIVRKWNSKAYYDRFFENANVPPHPSVFLRRAVYDQMGLFDLNFKLAADYEFLLRIFKSNLFKSHYVPEVFVKMRLGGATNKSFKNIIQGNKEIVRAWTKNGNKMPWYFFPLKFLKRFSQFF